MELSMKSVLFPSGMNADGVLSWLARIRAAAFALVMHVAVIVLLLAGWRPDSRAPEQAVRTMRTELVRLAPRKAEAPVAPAAAPSPPPAKPEPVPVPKPVSKPVPTPARAMPQPPKEWVKPKETRLAKPVDEHPVALPSQPALSASASASADNAQAQADADATQVMKVAAQNMAASATDLSQAYLPIAKTAPDYPSKALQRGIEGDCTVSYTVTPQGRVDQPKIVGDCHPLFVRPSLQAAQEFRYRPRIIAGSAVAVPNVHNTFYYRIESR